MVQKNIYKITKKLGKKMREIDRDLMKEKDKDKEKKNTQSKAQSILDIFQFKSLTKKYKKFIKAVIILHQSFRLN